MVKEATRSLITFAFVKEEFDRTGDLVAGLIPLFGPIFEKLSDQTFSGVAFCKEVQEFYGIRMSPWVAEDWIPRFEAAGFLESSGDHHAKSYRCVHPQPDRSTVTDDVSGVLDALVQHVRDRVSDHGLDAGGSDIEDSVIKRLKKPDFLHLFLKPELKRASGNTLHLPGTIASEVVDPEAIIDFVLAARILELYENNRAQFDVVSRIASGALVSEIVLNLREPPKVGNKIATNSVVYLDSPFVIDVLDLGDRQKHEYSVELLKDLVKAGAVVRTFDHNIEEIQNILNATLDNHNDVNSSVGTVAYRLRTDSIARSRAQAIRANLRKWLQSLSITPVSMDNATRGKEKYFPEPHITDLTAQIRPFGDIFSREVDALSIAGVARQILSVRPVSSVMSLSAIFVTKNSGLVRDANKFLNEQCNYPSEAAHPFLTDRQTAGVMWLALGGAAGNLAERQLLANCASAITPRRDVLSAVYNFLEQTDTRAAAEFEALMTEDRCAHYVMESALGDAALVTPENALEILGQVKRIAVDEVTRELEERKTKEVEEEKRRGEEAMLALSSTHEDIVVELQQETARQREALTTEIVAREQQLEETAASLAASSLELEQQSENLAKATDAVVELQRIVILRCVRGAHNHVVGMKVVLAIAISVMTALVGGIGGIALGFVEGWESTLMLFSATLFVTAALSSLMAWVIPDLLFGNWVTKQAHNKFDALVEKEGARNFAGQWQIDIASRSASRRI